MSIMAALHLFLINVCIVLHFIFSDIIWQYDFVIALMFSVVTVTETAAET